MPISWAHDLLCIQLLHSFICCPYTKRCPGHSQHGLSCWWGWRRCSHKLVSYAETHPPRPKIWEGGCQMAIMSHPPSPLITSRATKRSKANQTATQLSPPLPAGKTLGTGIVQDGGVWEIRRWEKTASQLLLPQGLQESTVLPHSMAPALRGHPPPRLLWCQAEGLSADPWWGRVAWRPGGSWWSWHGNHAPVPCRDMAPVHTWVTCVLRTHKVNYNATCRRYFPTNTDLLFFPYAPIWSSFSS